MRMKRWIASLLSGIMILSASLCYVTPVVLANSETPKLVFNAYEDYSAENNPNGPWTFSYMQNGTYTDLTYDAANEQWGTIVPGYIKKTTAFPHDWVTGQPALEIRAESLGTTVVVNFTAPYTGKMKVSMANGGVFSPHQSQDEVSFIFKHNDTVIKNVSDLDNSYNANRFFEDTVELTVKKGDVLRFMVQRNAQKADPRTFFNPNIEYTEVEDTQKLRFNAYEDYSDTKNPNGPWIFSYMQNDTYTDLTYDTANGYWGTVVPGYINRTVNYPHDWVTGQPALEIRPESLGMAVVVSFIAPYTGKVDVSMANGGVFAPHQNLDEVAFTFKHNDTVVKSVSDLDASYNANRFFQDTVGLTVQQGDVLRFMVQRNTQSADPRTFFNPLIVYTEVEEESNLSFPGGAAIEVSDVDINGFKVTWPSAVGDTGEFNYKIYCSETAFESEPTEGGIDVSGNTYTFTNLDYQKDYYIAVVVSDGKATAMLRSNVISITDEKLTFNAYKDYSKTDNPSGVWTYSHLVEETYVDLNYDAQNGWWGTETEGRLQDAASDLVTGRPALEVRPELLTRDVVVTFTAPYSGILKISMANGGVFAPHQSGGEVQFTVKHNAAEVKKISDLDNSYNAEGNRFFTEDVIRTVEVGDKIQFIVHRNAQIANPTTYFNPEMVYQAIGDDVLGFPGNSEITVSKMTTNGFTIHWPSAENGTGNYSYTVYCSETPFSGVPTTGGVQVDGNTYTFTNLEFGKSYYVAVAVDDGEHRVSLETPSAVKIFSEMFRFNAYEDFTKGSQNTCWQYLYANSERSVIKPLSWDGAHWGNQAQGMVERVDFEPVAGQKALCVTPGLEVDTIVAFTAPYTGNISVSMSNGGIYVPFNGEGDGYDGIEFTMLLNRETKVHFDLVSSKNIHAPSMNPEMYEGRLFADEYQMAVNAGDVLYFIVNKNTNLHNDETFFNPVIEYTSVDESTLNLRFSSDKNITASDVTKSSMTVNWPVAVGGTGEYEYTLYISDKPMKTVPAKGGINMGSATSYVMTGLPAYTKYYFAVVVNDGENQISLIGSGALSTIGNTYSYDAVKDYTTGLQPISTPWRYYWQDVKTGKYTELTWDDENKLYGSETISTLTKVESDMVTGAPALRVIPTAGKNAVIAFIAPYSGEITVDLSNGGVFAPYNGVPQQWDGINFTLKKDSEVLYSREAVSERYSHNDRCFATEISMAVKAGETLYFVVNSNKVADMDLTFLAPRVRYTYVNQGSDGFGFLPGATAKATDVKKNAFTLHWSSAFGAVNDKISYKVWISTSPIKRQPAGAPIYQGNQLKTVCRNLRFATKYYVYIVATDEAGNKAVLNPSECVMTECPEYDAYKQFVKEKNEAGVWNYAVRTYDSKTKTFEYTLLSWNDEVKGWGAAESGMIAPCDADPVTGLYAMSAHPGAEKQDAALVFTAPYSGTVRISMTNGGVYAPHNGEDQEYDGINFMVYHGEKELWNIEGISGKHILPGTRQGTDVIEIRVQQGEKLYFLVGANKNSAADMTYFNPLIEYLEVTGGTGVIDKLEGFVIPEPEPVHLPSFRKNAVFESDGIAVMFQNLKEAMTPWLWIGIYCGVVLIMASGIVVCFVKLKRRK